MSVLAAREAYRLWAPTYSDENAITHLENQVVDRISPSADGLRLLDVGCGTGRRLLGTGAAQAVGVELCPEMIYAGVERLQFGPEVSLCVGDAEALPCGGEPFDLTWCRLMVGHLARCDAAYAELARVTARGGWVIVTDFHAAAYAAGHRRTFRHQSELHEVVHHVHPTNAQIAAAESAGLVCVEVVEAEIGPEVRSYYNAAGRLELYREHVGLPVVLGLAFRREA